MTTTKLEIQRANTHDSGKSAGTHSQDGCDCNSENRREFLAELSSRIFVVALVAQAGRIAGASCGVEPIDCSGMEQDNTCSTDNTPDENCHTNGPGGGAGDEDDNCGVMKSNGEYDQDEGCGDCNDEHDDDNNCGNESDDPDNNCGHEHIFGTGDEDDNCTQAGDSDSGCGKHDNPYDGSWEDPDQGCNEPESPDHNCSDEDTDDNCNPGSDTTSQPDEACTTGNGGAYDEDNACEAWL